MIAAAIPVHLPGVLHSLEPTLNNFGYLAVLGLVLIEDFGVPVPGETVLILAAVYAGAGRLDVVLVGLLGFIGAVLAKFLVFNAIGAALWVAVWTSVGYFSGSHIDTIYHDATRYSTYLAIALGVLLLVFIARHVVRIRRARAPSVT
jgi:membrane protein DedA with SNARE-associated domain